MEDINYQVEICEFPVYGAERQIRELLSYTQKYKRYQIAPQRFISVRDALAIGPHLLVFQGDMIVAESSRGQASLARTPLIRRRGRGRYDIDPGGTSRRFTEPVVVVGGKASQAFFHWIVEILPRLTMVQEQFQNAMTIVLRPLAHRYQRESLEILGLRWVEVAEDVISAPEMWFPTHLVLPIGKGCMSPDLIGLSRQFSWRVPESAGLPRRIYISRGDAPKRRVANEQEVVAILQEHGFEPIRLSERPFAEQVALFRSAEAVIGPHGGGFASLVYCRPETKVVELYAEGFKAVSPFWNISSLAGLDYAMCLCEAELDARGSYHNGDMVVTGALLRTALERQGLI